MNLIRRATRLATGITFVLSIALAPSSRAEETPSAHPNVLLVTIDTCRADYLGCYGRALARTRCLDTVAAEGVRYTNAATAVPITLPSHATILTGLLPPAHGVRDNGAYALNDKTVTLAERLKDAGYATHAAVSALVLAKQYNLTQGFDSYDDDLSEEDAPPMFMIPDRPAQRTSARVTAWLDHWWGSPDKGAASGVRPPFFLWTHFFDPHQPWEARISDRHLCPTPYDAEIAQADQGVEAIVTWLKAKGVLDNTLVIVTADHGESLGEHKEKTHAIFIYDATIRVPLLIRYPRLVPAGTVSDSPARTVDIVATILSVLGLPGAETTQGANLLPPSATASPSPQYCESLLSEVGFGMAPLFGLRLDGYKFIRAPRPELYDLSHDPRELNNIIADNAPLAAKLDAELERIQKASTARATDSVPNPLDTETTQMLEALGYLAPQEARVGLAGMDPKDGIEIYTRLEEARNLVRHQELEPAVGILRRILETAPNHASALNVLGGILAQQNHLADATEAYQRSLKASPRQYRVMLSLGRLAERQGRHDDATRWYQQALELAPRLVEAMMQLSFIAEQRNDTPDAERWRAKAEAETPDEPRVALALADLHFAKKHHAEALKYYEQVLTRRPTHFHALLQAGVCAAALGQTKDADRFYQRALDARPDSWMPPYNLACRASVTGDPEAARRYLTQAMEKASGKPGALQRLRTLARRDPDLAAVRATPEFPKLIESAAQPPTP